MGGSFDLKSFRETKLKMSQLEFANLIGECEESVSRMEKDPTKISVDVLMTIARKTGQTIDQLLNFKKPETKVLSVENTWEKVETTKRTIIDYIEHYAATFKEEAGSDYTNYISDLNKGVTKAIRKPKIALVGRSDAGKSTLINALIGVDKVPTSWTPTTSIIIFLKHISDRPKFIEEDVWIFKNDNNNSLWDDTELENEEYCRNLKLAGGNIELVSSYGTRQGENYDQNEAGAAVVFVDSDLLRNCDILDVPGYGTGDRIEDDTMSLNAKQKANVLIYLSAANTFMRDEDIAYLKEAITMLNPIENKENNIEPLSNLFIVASQAHIIDGGNIDSLNTILDEGCARFEKTITDNFWVSRESLTGKKYGHDIFRSRFFTYTTDIEHVRSQFETDLKRLVELLPNEIESKAKDFICKYAEENNFKLTNEILAYDKLITEKHYYEELLDEIEKNDPSRIEKNKIMYECIKKCISMYNSSSLLLFERRFDEVISVDNIVDIIEKRGYKNKKEDIQLLVTYISSVLDEELQTILKQKSQNLSDNIDEYIEFYQTNLNIETKKGIKFDKSLFNAKRAFASGLAGIATFGGLAVWASTLGNLGAYILVAKSVSLLASLGISVGGTAAAAATVASMGGPVPLGIALSVIAAMSVFALLSGGWQKKIAKKIVAVYSEEDAITKYKDIINTYWEDTDKAFNVASDNMECEWQVYVKNLHDLIDNYDIENIKDRIGKAKGLIDFLNNIPL